MNKNKELNKKRRDRIIEVLEETILAGLLSLFYSDNKF
jgi:hypothetical protein